MLRFFTAGTVALGAVLVAHPTSAPERHAIHALRTTPRDSGVLMPLGPPVSGPTRTNAGRSCVVDLAQGYSFRGALSGAAEINYRILVAGPCGAPPGTYEEEWIAHGKFRGQAHADSVAAHFSYVARAHAGGEVEGHIVFGQGLGGVVEVLGNFNDGRLTYRGRLE
jgi:hypothetical protein